MKLLTEMLLAELLQPSAFAGQPDIVILDSSQLHPWRRHQPCRSSAACQNVILDRDTRAALVRGRAGIHMDAVVGVCDGVVLDL